MTTTTGAPPATHEQTLAALASLNAEYATLMNRNPDEFRHEDQAVAMVEIHRREAQIWSDMDIHEANGATGLLLVRGQAAAIARARGFAATLSRCAINEGCTRYRQELRHAQRSDRVLAYGAYI